MKLTINWDEAPEWANYAAMDENGSIWFYEEKPKMFDSGFGIEIGSGKRMEGINVPEHKWKNSLTTRPGVDDD